MIESISGFPFPLLIIYFEKTLDENAENKHLEGVFVLYSFFVWNSKKYVFTYVRENKIAKQS